MASLWSRAARWLRSRDRPAPRALVALWLAWRWGARVSWRADIRKPGYLTLGRGARVGRCTIVCTAPISLGAGVELRDGAVLDAQGGPIRIGDRTGINPYCVLYGAGGLSIGADVLIATHTVIIPANHRTDRLDVPINQQGSSMRGVEIGDDVWIGAHCVVLDGISIGSGAIVAAGAVVTRNVAPRHVVAGVPAETIRVRGAEPGRAVDA